LVQEVDKWILKCPLETAPLHRRRVGAATRRNHQRSLSVAVHEPDDADIAYTAWDAEFGQRINEVDKLRRKHPVASEQDDLAELIRSLSDGPDAVIRQLPSAARDTLMLLDDPHVSRAKLADTLGNAPTLMQSLWLSCTT
jgi:hypothetical protein